MSTNKSPEMEIKAVPSTADNFVSSRFNAAALLQAYHSQMKDELAEILRYWMENAVDERYGGFFGKVDADNRVIADAPKGCVLNSRILWTFAAAYNQTANQAYLKMAERAYQYLNAHFRDRKHGGVYWSVDYQGQPLSKRKQIYGLAFCIYGLSEFYQTTRKDDVLVFAKELYYSIEEHSFDPERGGYFEAFNHDWSPLEDLRLSEKDANERKTMNTHLHVLEAYTNLYRVWPDRQLAQQIRSLIDNFLTYVIDPETHHLHLFMDDDWTVKSRIISYGHDIEASWLLLEAAEVLHDDSLIEQVKQRAIQIAIAASRGMDPKGGLNYEWDGETNHLSADKHWWVQAEAMVGFFNAWQLSQDQSFLHKTLEIWEYTKCHILDKKHGEWFWGVTADNVPMPGEDKMGFWKCPYHNGRACIEIISRIKRVLAV
jgi:cellobiose epimerase